MRVRLLATAVALCVALGARAEDPFPARGGESGILDVPDARAVGKGRGLLGAELRFDQPANAPGASGPLPVYAVAGVADRIDVGLTMREWGQPGDPTPGRMVYGGAAKLQLVGTGAGAPAAIAIGAMIDRANTQAVGGARLIASADLGPELQLAAFFGGEALLSGGGDPGEAWGGALAFRVMRGVSAAVEYVSGPRGENVGAAIRWNVRPTLGFQIGANYLPSDDGFRVFMGVALRPPPVRVAPAERREVVRTPAPELPPQRGPVFADARPRFRLRMPVAGPGRAGDPRRLQYGPWSPTVAAVPERPVSSVPAAMPSVDDLADAQLRDQEALADARERRGRATADQLDARERTGLDQVRRLEERERELAAREQQLDARDRRIAVRGTPTQQQRALESLETQLASQERNLTAQDRSFAPALDAARGRERNAAAREDAERQEASRLSAAAGAASSRPVQIDLRRQALAARNRQLAALEARLVAKGELIDAIDRQSRVKRDRLDARQRRLDARSERLDLIERGSAEPRPAPAGASRPVDGGAMAPKDRAVFVMVVKTPSSIVKGQPSASAAPSGAAAGHPGVSLEKVVTAATVITFATPASQLSELDRDTLDRIAKLAAKDHCELMIWARAKDPSLQGEAQRRAAEIKARAVAEGPLDERLVTTRVTIRPAAKGVDVVVTALRESATPAPAAPSAPSAPAPSGPSLEGGEGGKRQIRQVVQLAQGSIEACVADMMDQRKLARAEGVLKLTISTAGKVAKVGIEGDFGGTAMAECLTGASSAWAFPNADAEYVVDVPITVMRGEAAR